MKERSIFEIVHVELLQVVKAGVTGAEVIDGEPHAHLVELAEQGERLRVGHQQLPLGEFQHQHHPPRHKMREEGATLRQQGKIPAVGGADVEADVKSVRQPGLHLLQTLGHDLHEMSGHGHDQPRFFRLGDEEIRADQARFGWRQRISTSAPTILPSSLAIRGCR